MSEATLPPRICASCRFWQEANNLGYCRRRSPMPTNEDKVSSVYASWPRTDPEDWCGEFKHLPRPEPAPKPRPAALEKPLKLKPSRTGM